MARSRDISKVLSSSTALATDAEIAATYQTKASAGLVLLNTTSFSAVTIASLPENIFTSTYNTYLFTFDVIGSTAITIQARVRAAGVDFSSANYNRTQWEGTITAATSSNQTSWDVTSIYDADAKRAPIDFTLTDVQVSGRNKSAMSRISIGLSTGAPYPILRFFSLNSTSSYDSITFFTDTGNMTGSISCYGYNQ
jgi:hypothetical protein